MSEKSELEQRVAVTETKIEDIKLSISEMKEITFAVKEHLIRQNGALPRLEKSVTMIADQINTFDKKLDVSSEKLVSVTLKVKILWSIIATIGGTIFVAIMGYLFSKF
ncbi:MAG: hypothetical protein Q8Q92_03470 [bacterium]|nr:hypothetical protein [bacterium]